MNHIQNHRTETIQSPFTHSISMRFEPLRKEQEEMVKQWLQQDYVAQFWYGVGLQNTLKSISRFVNEGETLYTLWIAYDKAIPFGYLMTSKIDFEEDHIYAKYLNPSSKAITLDLLIGNPSYLGKGLSHEMIRELLLQKFSDVTDVFIDPGIDNPKAIHVYEKVGFQKLEEFIPEWDPTSSCVLMHLKMEQLQCVEPKPKAVEVYRIKPEDFRATVQVSACYLEVEGQLLLLKCADSKVEAGKWGVPAGKLEIGETPKQAAERELLEETGILIQSSEIEPIVSLYIRKPDIDYVYHLFQVTLKTKPEVRLSNEHPNYLWALPQEVETLPLMVGAFEALHEYRLAIAQKKRITASVNVHLILQRGNQVLLQLRQNTGYLDDHWSLAAGHVEPGEPATAAMIREAQEEIGIQILPEDLTVVHIMHCKTNRMNVDIFFLCDQWKGEPVNSEPEKCKEIAFFSLDTLPSPFTEYNALALQAWTQGQFYSECGFI